MKSIHIVGAQFAGKVTAVIGWTFLLSLLSKQLTTVDFGLFILIANFGLITVLVAGFGQSQVILFLNGSIGSKDRTFTHFMNLKKSLFIICTLGLITSLLGGLFLKLYFSSHEWGLFLLFAFWAFFSTLQTFFAEESKTVFRFWVASFLSTSGGVGGALATTFTISFLLLNSIFFKIPVNLTLALIALFGGAFLASLLLIIPLFSEYKVKRHLEIYQNDYKYNHFELGGLSIAASIFIFVLGQSDVWFVSYYYDEGSVGTYGIATYLARFISMASILLTSSFSNQIALLIAQKEYKKLRGFVNRLNLISFIFGFLTLIVLIGMWKLSAISYLFKVKEAGFFTVFIVISLGHLFGSYWGLGPVILITSGKFKAHLIIALFCTFFALMGAILLNALFKMPGISFAYGLSYVIYTTTCNFYVSKNFRRIISGN